jgi:hypothetical protein
MNVVCGWQLFDVTDDLYNLPATSLTPSATLLFRAAKYFF